MQLQLSSNCPSFSSKPNLFVHIAQEPASLRVRRIFIRASTGTQCLAIFLLIHQLVFKVKKDLLAEDYLWKSSETTCSHFMSSAKMISDNIFWFLSIWPRSNWTIPKVGSKKTPPHILYQILLAIHTSTWINFKCTYQPNDSLSSHWMSRTFCTHLPQHFKTLLPWLKKMPLPALRGRRSDHWVGKVVPG